ncbi:MAG: class I SAM-dependent methyltransferase [Pseudolabrys sp.]|nr:class I SAM-dependent methyltransferase [Pseudolabrys sp.]
MPSSEEFLAPQCSVERLDTCLSRRSIVDALTEHLPRLEGVVLDIGCGQKSYKPLLLSKRTRVTRYIGLDIKGSKHPDAADPPDLEWDGVNMPLESGSIDCAIATEMLHQCQRPEIVLAEAARVLKPEGTLFISVPFLWPVHDGPADQVRFTPFALERHLHDAGFQKIRIVALGGWDASLAQMLGLWVRRRPMRRRYRAILSRVAQPLIRLLMGSDRRPDLSQAIDSTIMVTGLAATAVNGPRSG